MVFSSLTFLYVYLPIVLFIYYISPLQCRNVVLFIVSLIFYGWSNPLYICIMLFSIIMNYMFGRWIKTYQNKAKTLLILCIICNLSILFFFKYYTFVNNTLQSSGIHILPALSIALPIGISFYTFQAMSYPIDLYTNTITPQKSLINFGTYVTMFPQLIAGPIVRYKDIASQLTQRKYTFNRFSYGMQRFVIGLSKKVMLANTCGEIYESIEALHFSETSVCTSWIGILCYTFQIYFDFSGYSDMAIGLGEMFGIHFLENFNYPYISKSITEFWRRWHISLSSWFKDYVYIPLGGNRKGYKQQCLNLFVVWLLCGLWHGASWNFVLWGAFYGIVLWIEKTFLSKILAKIPKVFAHLYTMIVVMLAWVLFSHTDISQAIHSISMLFGNCPAFYNAVTFYYIRNNAFLFMICFIACTPVAKTKWNVFKKLHWLYPVVLMILMILSTAFIINGTYNPFLYFRF